MKMLIADRFVCGPCNPGIVRAISALDLATGQHVRMRFNDAGTRIDQQAWVESCAHAHGAGKLVDYGFIGPCRKFEATTTTHDARRASSPAAPADVLDWLNMRRRSSAGILSLAGLPDARTLRLQGFVPVAVSLVSHISMRQVWPLLEGHSIVLLGSWRSPAALAFAFLDLRCARVRDACALARRRRGGEGLIAHAAEGRAAYEPRPAAMDLARAGGLLGESERLLAAGRHAAAERGFRAAAGAFHRRGDACRAGEAEMALGRLLLTRGRAEAARAAFDGAYRRFHEVGAPLLAVAATVHLAMAQADLGLMSDAERGCRAAHSAAAALNDRDATAAAVIALVRTLIWLERHAEGAALLESIAPGASVDSASPGVHAEATARYWCLVARLHLAGDRHADAWRSVVQARRSGHACPPAIESLVRRWEAAVQARVGDLDALHMHVRIGVAAARAAHMPLRALKLRLVLVDALIDGGKMGRARTAARHLHGIGSSAMPPLLREHVKRTLVRLSASPRSIPAPQSTVTARETAAVFHANSSPGALADLEKMADLLSSSNQVEDEAQALSRAAVSVQKHLRALGVGVFGGINGEARLFASAGPFNQAIACRSCDAGSPIGPEPAGGWVDAAVPIRYLGRCIGALAIRWTAEGPDHHARAVAFAAAAAAACAPLVYVIFERQATAVPDQSRSEFVGLSAAIEVVRRAIARAANAPFTVLIEGESGSGKELVARAIHESGSRRERRFCAFNCAAMAEDLVDAELFGHTKGAFTGAAGERLGLFESADHGTVFLDEVGELSVRAQAKILRALQEGEVRRIGENFSRPFDARLVAATNRSLRAEVDAGRFRQDLLYRLDVIRIRVPPLRERVEDIPLLAAKFWRQAAERVGSRAVLGQGALSALARYDWPGNVRELQNVLSALVVAAPARGVVGASDMPAAIARSTLPGPDESLESARLKFEQRFVRAALARAAGHRGETAAALGLSRQGLAKLMQRLHLDA